jgi:Mg2+ and Co2+ transporter CorA
MLPLLAHNRHLKNTALLKIYLNIYNKKTIRVHQVYSKLMNNRVNEWFTNFYMAGSLVLVCQNDFSI